MLACWFSASAVVPALRRDWDVSAFEATLLTVAVQIGFVVGAVTSAALNLADRFPATGWWPCRPWSRRPRPG